MINSGVIPEITESKKQAVQWIVQFSNGSCCLQFRVDYDFWNIVGTRDNYLYKNGCMDSVSYKGYHSTVIV